jgi:hypothetical protein
MIGPECGTAVDIEWCDVTTLTDRTPIHIPGEMVCPSNRRHNVGAAYQELRWPVELAEEDRAWLRRQYRLAEEFAEADRAIRAVATEGSTRWTR